MQRQIAAVWQKDRVLSPAAAALLQMTTDLISQETNP
jgi:hypothetical protein